MKNNIKNPLFLKMSDYRDPEDSVRVNRVIVRDKTHGNFYITNGRVPLKKGRTFQSFANLDGDIEPVDLRITKVEYTADQGNIPPFETGVILVEGDCTMIHKGYWLLF